MFQKKKGGIFYQKENLFNPAIKFCGQFVVVLYERNIYSGEIIRFNEDNVYISALLKVTSRRSGERSQVPLNMNRLTR
jgi:hypothetical protein